MASAVNNDQYPNPDAFQKDRSVMDSKATESTKEGSFLDPPEKTNERMFSYQKQVNPIDSEDAKVCSLKQMFYDYSKEELCSIIKE